MRGMTEVAHIFRLSSRALIRVAGPDWRSFLQGLLTQDVETLGTREIRYGALLNPQGKLLYDLFLIGEADGCLVDVAAAHREALVLRLTLYRLRAKVEISAVEGEVLAAWGDAAPGDGWLADPRLPALGWRAYGVAADGADIGGEDAYDAHRLSLGVPDPAKDCPPESAYPIEANFDLLHGIDFQKGCFVGQETTSRMKRRGMIKSRMVGLSFDGPAPTVGAEVLNGELRAGEVVGGADRRALALVRLDRIEGALTVDGRAVRVERPGYFADVS
jgi:folate-binding protein YgfZ